MQVDDRDRFFVKERIYVMNTTTYLGLSHEQVLTYVRDFRTRLHRAAAEHLKKRPQGFYGYDCVAWVKEDKENSKKNYPPLHKQSIQSLLEYAIWLGQVHLWLFRGDMLNHAKQVITKEVVLERIRQHSQAKS